MPRHAIELGVVDRVLAPERIAGAILAAGASAKRRAAGGQPPPTPAPRR